MTRRLPFISVGVRVVINVEALNMVESVGNVVRHRVVPVIVQRAPGDYIVRWVPAISGETLAHAYQTAIVELAREYGCEKYLCYWCSRGEFLKHFDLEFYQAMREKRLPLSQSDEAILEVAKSVMSRRDKKATLEDVKHIESTVVKSCIVEDLGGFLITQGPVKRTSVFQFSWVIPTVDSIEVGAAILDNQFLVRHAPNAQAVATQIGWGQQKAQPQAPYYVQIASAVYAFTFNIDLEGICKSSIDDSLICREDDECGRRCRALIALEALGKVLEGWFGARRSRNLPFMEYECILALVSERPVTVFPPTARFREFVKGTIELAERSGARLVAWIPPEKWHKLVSLGEKDEELKRIIEKLEKIARHDTSYVKAFIEDLKKVVETEFGYKLQCPK